MPCELFFLVGISVPTADIEVGMLTRMKVPGQHGGSELTHIATISEEIGRQLIIGRRLEKQIELRAQSRLMPEDAEKAQAHNVILFESSAQVERYLSQGDGFDFVNHIFSFQDAKRRLRNVP